MRCNVFLLMKSWVSLKWNMFSVLKFVWLVWFGMHNCRFTLEKWKHVYLNSRVCAYDLCYFPQNNVYYEGEYYAANWHFLWNYFLFVVICLVWLTIWTSPRRKHEHALVQKLRISHLRGNWPWTFLRCELMIHITVLRRRTFLHGYN